MSKAKAQRLARLYERKPAALEAFSYNRRTDNLTHA